MMMKASFGFACAAAMALTYVSSARADIEYVDQFRSQFNTQTGDGPSIALNGYAFSARLFASSANLYDTVTVTSPGLGSPVNLTVDPTDPTTYGYGSSLYATTAAMDTDYPSGTYDYSAMNASVTDTTSVNYQASDYPQSEPYLAGSTFSSLQGMNPFQAFQVQFSPFTTGSNASVSFIFFTIFDNTTNTNVYDAGFLDPSATGVTLAANTLQPGHDFTYELIFSNRDFTSSPDTTYQSVFGFDYRTSGSFSTAAVPEPSSLALTGAGLLALGFLRLRRSRSGSR